MNPVIQGVVPKNTVARTVLNATACKAYFLFYTQRNHHMLNKASFFFICCLIITQLKIVINIYTNMAIMV